MVNEFDDDTSSHIDDDEMISSDIEDDDDINHNDNNKDDDDDDDDKEEKDDDVEHDDDELRKKLHKVKISTEREDTNIIVVKPENRITSDHLNIYEYTSVVGTRATHIANGSIIYTSINNISDPREIAKKEIRENKCPLTIVRKLGNSNKIELWEVNEMIKPLI